MDYKHEFSDLRTDKESIDYINNYKESLKSYPNLLKRIRPEIKIPPYASIKRTQIIQELRHYFESISRTKDLAKNLWH